MTEIGTRPAGIEVGNAWALHEPGAATNWIVGETRGIAPDSLRHMAQGAPGDPHGGQHARKLGVKWFVHRADEPPEWGVGKPVSEGRTLSILVDSGAFELAFAAGASRYTVTLNAPGDFAIWGPGIDHRWRTIGTCTILSVRWHPV